MTVTVVDRGPGFEIRKVVSNPTWGKIWQFATSYLLFLEVDKLNGQKFSALGLARAAAGRPRLEGAPKKQRKSKKK